MSRHTFASQIQGRPVRVICGWDTPMQGYFMQAQYTDTLDPEAAMIYSNLFQPEPHPPSFTPFLVALAHLGIDPPDGLVVALMEDKARNNQQLHRDWDS